MTSMTKRDQLTAGLIPLFIAALVAVMMLPPTYAVLLVAAAGGAWAVLHNPAAGVGFLVVLLPANNLISQLLGGGGKATAFGAVKDAVLLLLLVAAVQRRAIRRDLAPLVVGVAVFGLIGFAYASSVSNGLYGWRNDYEPVLLLLAAPAVLNPAQVERVKTGIVAAGQVVAAVGVLTWQRGLSWLYTVHVASPGVYPFQYFSSGNHRPRAFSPLAAPNELGAYLDITLAVIVTRSDWTVKRRAVLCVLPLVGIYLARSRSGLIGAALLFAVIAVRAVKHRSGTNAAAGLATVLGLTLLAVLLRFLHNGGIASTGDLSLTGHAQSLQTGIADAVTHPLGYGLGNVGPRALLTSQNPVLVESFWLLMALESGLLVLAAYLLLLGRITIRAVKADAVLVVACVAATLTTQLVLPTMQDGAVSFMFWLVIGLGYTQVSTTGSRNTRSTYRSTTTI